MGVTPKRVLIISSYLMFGVGLESLLSRAETIEVVGREENIGRALEQIDSLAPDVIILDGDEPPYDGVATLLTILRSQTVSKIIGLNLQNNSLRVYEARQWQASGVEDLVAAIWNDPPAAG
jgi:chemotaxis response regulator CheB